MNKILNIKQVESLISETYMYAIIIAIAALLLAFIIANLINFEGGKNERSYIKRRIWFIVISALTPISFFLYNALIVSQKIVKPPLVAKFTNANIVSTLIILAIIVVVGIITMLIFRKSKWGSILGKTNK